MRIAPQITTVVCLVLLLSWFSMRAINPEAERFDRALAELDHFAMIENALYRNVFTARVGMLRNYDPLVSEINSLRDSMQRLRDGGAFEADTAAAIDDLAASIDREDGLLELFKSQNALLHNSLSFFGRFDANATSPQLAPTISAAAASILHLTLDTSPAVVRRVQDRLDDLEKLAGQVDQDDVVVALLAHGRLLNELLPSVDGILKAMRVLPQKQARDVLRTRVLQDQLASRTQARLFRSLLYGTSLLLVAFLVNLGVRLKSRADALLRRAAFEHLVADISMRFIKITPQTIDVAIDRALIDMASFFGSDRAYFVMIGPMPRQHVWHKPGHAPPPGWPEQAPELAERISESAAAIIHIPNVRQMPISESKAICLELGLRGWACATSIDAGGGRVALGFDAIEPRSVSKAGEFALLRTALDTIGQAVERNAIEKERMRLEVRLRHARRMEKIGIFTSGIAHNFNNILGGILGHAEVIEEYAGPDAKLVRNLGGIRRSAERARDLIDQILIFGRRREFARKPLSVGALIAETTSLLKVSLPPDIDLIIRQPPMAAVILGERSQLQQVLLNLCNNAANAMAAGGRIEISTELREVLQPHSLGQNEIAPGNYVCITVVDTGSGMDEAMLSRIFEPFFTTRSSGNGLGLATVHEIVRDHEGAVNVASKPGEGSRFEVWLPQVAALEQSPQSGAAALPTGRGQTIMLVARDRERVLLDEEMLAALGYEPVGFTAADAATAACRTTPHRFDMVIVGGFGSVTESLDTAAALHAVLPRVPIVLATATAIEIDADTLVSAGISDVVRWPMMAEEIAIVLAEGSAIEADMIPSRQSKLAAPAIN